MNKILEMRENRANLWDKAKAFLEGHKDEKGLLNAEDTATYERMEKEITDLGAAIEREERAAAIENEMNKATSKPILDRVEKPEAEDKKGTASKTYNREFWNALRGRFNANTRNALEEGEASEGGYLVPEEFDKTLIMGLEENNKLRSLATVIRTSGTHKIPIVSEHGTASWLDEEGQYQESDEVFGQISLGAFKIGTAIKVSEELMNDSMFNLEAYLAAEFSRRIGNAEESAFITGNGSGKPYGLAHATYGASTGVTTASATAITADEIIDLVYSLKSPYRTNASFLLNDASVKAIRKLKDGQGQYLWQPGIKEGEPDRLLGYRMVTSGYAPAIEASAKPIFFGDFKYLWIADRQGRIFQRLNELFAMTGQVGFRGMQRVDARVVLPEAIKAMVMHA